MYILLTDPFSRKTFDIANILKKRNYKLLIAYDGNLVIKTIIQALYSSKIVKLRKSNFNQDLQEIENNNKEIVFFPIEEQTILNFYNYLDINKSSKIQSMLPSKDVFHLVRDKGKFSSFCLSNNINVPREYSFSDLANFNDLPSPLIVKPKISSGSVGIKFIDSLVDINDIQKLDSSNYLIQERIKNGQNILGGFFLTHNGKLVSYYGHKRIRTYPEEGGVTVYSKVDINNDIEELGSSLLYKLNWSGLAMIEFLFDEDSKAYKIIEVNPRAWGSIMLSEFCESNMITNYINLSVDKSIEMSNIKDDVFIRWFFPWDVISYIKKRGNIERFWNIDLKNTCYINFTYANIFQAILFLFMNIFNHNKLKKLYQKVFKI